MTLDELLVKVDEVTGEDVLRVARSVFDPEEQFTLCLGPDRG